MNLSPIIALGFLVNQPMPNPAYNYTAFVYDVPLTNVFVECSTNLRDWHEAMELYDYTWGKDNMGSYIAPTYIVAHEFFRIRGMPVNSVTNKASSN